MPVAQEDKLIINPNPTEPLIGKVVAVGLRATQQGYNTDMTVKYNRFAGDSFEHKGEDFTAITHEDILKIL
jgi:co-chaperonin GroES (HSP10)